MCYLKHKCTANDPERLSSVALAVLQKIPQHYFNFKTLKDTV